MLFVALWPLMCAIERPQGAFGPCTRQKLPLEEVQRLEATQKSAHRPGATHNHHAAWPPHSRPAPKHGKQRRPPWPTRTIYSSSSPGKSRRDCQIDSSLRTNCAGCSGLQSVPFANAPIPPSLPGAVSHPEIASMTPKKWPPGSPACPGRSKRRHDGTTSRKPGNGPNGPPQGNDTFALESKMNAYPCTKTTCFQCVSCAVPFVVPHGCPTNRIYECPACGSFDTIHTGRCSQVEVDSCLLIVLDDERLQMPPQYHDMWVSVRV